MDEKEKVMTNTNAGETYTVELTVEELRMVNIALNQAYNALNVGELLPHKDEVYQLRNKFYSLMSKMWNLSYSKRG